MAVYAGRFRHWAARVAGRVIMDANTGQRQHSRVRLTCAVIAASFRLRTGGLSAEEADHPLQTSSPVGTREPAGKMEQSTVRLV